MEKEQIVKALECCGKVSCKECPFAVKGKGDIFDDTNCIAEMAAEARSIIREQDKRIEELEAKNKKLNNTRYMVCSDGRIEMIPSAECVRNETVRKMQKRLANRYEFNCNADEENALDYADLCEWVERIANELLEEENDESST